MKNARLGISLLIAIIVMGALLMKMSGGGVAPVPPAFTTGLTVQQGIERGSQSGKPVLVFATADWCGPCQRFKRGPLKQPEITSFITEHFEPVYLDVDRDGALAAKLEIESVPALRVLRPGAPIAKTEGYLEPGRLLAWLRETSKS